MLTRVGLVGKMGVGKDAAAGHLHRKYGFRIMAFATPIRDMVKYIYGDTWHTDGRRLMQGLAKTMRDIDSDILVKPIERMVVDHPDMGIVINDVRFKNEVVALRRLGFTVFRLDASCERRMTNLKKRDGFMPSLETLNHSSEVDLDDVDLPTINADLPLLDFLIEVEKAVVEC